MSGTILAVMYLYLFIKVNDSEYFLEVNMQIQ